MDGGLRWRFYFGLPASLGIAGSFILPVLLLVSNSWLRTSWSFLLDPGWSFRIRGGPPGGLWSGSGVFLDWIRGVLSNFPGLSRSRAGSPHWIRGVPSDSLVFQKWTPGLRPWIRGVLSNSLVFQKWTPGLPPKCHNFYTSVLPAGQLTQNYSIGDDWVTRFVNTISTLGFL